MWPLQLRTESSHEEGGVREWAVATTEFEGDAEGNVTALKAVRAQLDRPFEEAVELIVRALRQRGKIIVVGVGKSGNIGRKIAATLASCGTPAVFIHPAEAGHGDLGMITSQDVVLALSNSGETDELVHLLPHLKRQGAAIIALTGNEHSSLAQAAAIAALDDEEWVRKSREHNLLELAFLQRELARRGIRFTPSVTNFVLVEFDSDVKELFLEFLRAGVIIRPVGGPGLVDCARVSVGTHAENERFLAALDHLVYRVARGARDGRNDGAFGRDQRVQQRGLAYVRAADDGDFDGLDRRLFRRRGGFRRRRGRLFGEGGRGKHKH